MRTAIFVGSLAFALTLGIAAADEVKDPDPPELVPGSPEAAGGPDGFGYTFIDSTEPDGPVFEWFDITGHGTQVPLSDDDYFYPIDIGFPFDFYGVTYYQIAVASNGTIYFIDDYLGLENSCIPGVTAYPPQAFVAGYWDDLDPSAAGEVLQAPIFCDPCRDSLVIQWNGVPHYGSGDTVTFQIVLYYGTNNIRVQYLDPSTEAGSGATVGIQGDPTTGLEYGCDEGVLAPTLAICFVHPDSMDPICTLNIPTMRPSGLALTVLLLLVGSLSILRRRASCPL